MIKMDSTQLVQIRKDFYKTIRKRAEAITGFESKQLRQYHQSYDKELNQLSWTALDKKHLFSRLKKANIVLVGDFHAQKQSTRGFLRIVRKMKAPVVLALECLTEKDQPAIDSFIQGELSEKDFLNRVAWKKTWGFPWENYRPLFKWAQANKISVYGINEIAVKTTLKDRDIFAANRVFDISRKNPDKKIFIQYGDFHIASAHLPRQLRKKMPALDLCTVYQSPEIIYFKIMEKQKDLTTDIVKLTDDQWALNVLPPWVKWQDYLLYLESGYDKRIRVADVDPTDSVCQSVELLAKSFGIKVDTSSLSIYGAHDDAFFDQVDRLARPLKRRLLENVQEGLSFYIPEIEIGYLARLSVNHVTKVASQYIYYKEKGYRSTILDPQKDFLKLIWLEAVTYFCSKVSNPKRKTDTLQDIREALQKEQFDDRGKEALMLSLAQKLSELQFLVQNKLVSDARKKKYGKKSYTISSQILGGILGEKFFYALTKRLIRFPINKSLLFKDLQNRQFHKIYYESLEMVESWPLLFKSKYDKM